MAAVFWYKSWYPRVAEASGRWFVGELDDVKDHNAQNICRGSSTACLHHHLGLEEYKNRY